MNYLQVSQRDPSEAEDVDGLSGGQKHRRTDFRAVRPASIIHWFAHSMSLVATVMLYLVIRDFKSAGKHQCALRHNTWTPAFEELGDRYQTIRFEGAFARWTPFKGPPTDTVDEAWKQITDDIPLLNVTRDQMVALDRSLDSVQYPAEVGVGYLGILEAVHQLHCLKKIWQDHHIEHYPEILALKNDKPLFYSQHYEHCVDIIRQRLMCTADTGIVTFRWVKGVHGPYPDFNTDHRCQSWTALVEYAGKHGVDLPGDYVWPNEPEEDASVRMNHVP